jgi:hypothetical protein
MPDFFKGMCKYNACISYRRYRDVIKSFLWLVKEGYNVSIENGYSRWLTHEEICNRIIESISKDRLVTIDGMLEPWEKRPLK